MRTPAVILIILLVSLSVTISACSLKEFEDDLAGIFTGIFNKIDNTIKKNTTTTTPLPEIEKCFSDTCIRDAFLECTYAEGEFDTRGRHARMQLEPMTITLGEKTEMQLCKINYTIISSDKASETGKNLECTLPFIMLISPEESLTVDNPFCGGTLFDLLTPTTNYTERKFTIKNFTIQEKTISFYFENNDKTIYLKNALVLGTSFSDCILDYKNPVRINKKEPQIITLGCTDIQAAGSRANGIFFISYYTTPNAINMTTINGTFVGTVSK